MTRISFATALLLFMLATPLVASAQDAPRIAFIDSQAVLNEAPGAQEAERRFNEQMEEYRAEIERMGEDLDQMISQYQQQEATLSQDARERRQQEIRQRELEYNMRVDEMEAEAAERRAELVEPIIDRMSQTIEQIRTEGGYAMIFDAAARSIIAADPSLDLTDEVIRRLHAQGQDREEEDS